KFGVLHGSASYVLQTEDGQIAEAHSVSAGLDYPGVGPELAQLRDLGRLDVRSATDDEALASFELLSRAEGILPALESAHASARADVVELGIPFSDPIADGPTIQAASDRALRGGTTVRKVIDLVKQVRGGGVDVPIVLMGYLNPILAVGVEAFCGEAAAAGVD